MNTDAPHSLQVATDAMLDNELPAHSRVLKILYAEDVHVNQLITQAQLDSMGHSVDLVETGLAAIHALAKHDYDLILMDGLMPEMGGADAARVIRAGGLPDCPVRNPAIYIIALSANASSEGKNEYLAAGMNDCLVKPVWNAQLYAALSRAIVALEIKTPPSTQTAPSGKRPFCCRESDKS